MYHRPPIAQPPAMLGRLAREGGVRHDFGGAGMPGKGFCWRIAPDTWYKTPVANRQPLAGTKHINVSSAKDHQWSVYTALSSGCRTHFRQIAIL